MLSLQQTCRNASKNSLMAHGISVILEHALDGQDLPEDIQNEIHKRKEQLNSFLASALNGQRCTINYYPRYIHCLSCVPELIRSGADLFTTNNMGQSALHVAAKLNDVPLVQFLLDRCTSENLKTFINEQDRHGYTPLHCAAAANAPESMQLLIKTGADVYAQDMYKRTPLHLAAASDAIKSIILLLEHGVAIDALDAMGNTPLHLAARIDNEQAVECLLERGAQPAIHNEDNKTPLDFAYQLGTSKSGLLLKDFNKK